MATTCHHHLGPSFATHLNYTPLGSYSISIKLALQTNLLQKYFIKPNAFVFLLYLPNIRFVNLRSEPYILQIYFILEKIQLTQ